MNRRFKHSKTVPGLAAFFLACFLAGCGEASHHRMIIIGIDGMDHKLCRAWMDQGLMPNLSEMEREGGFTTLGTSRPPESPVAWSNFITGLNPGGHGVFDFFVPAWAGEMFTPTDAVAGIDPVTKSIELCGYEFPLAGGGAYNKRLGTAFWEVLEEHGIPATIFKIPADYPPSPTGQKTLSGMGTPDVRGGYGRYYVYTEDESLIFSDRVETGQVVSISIRGNRFIDYLYGPENAAKAGADKPTSTVPLTVYLDPENPVVKIVIGDEDSDPREIILKEGEWSDFVEMDFEMIPYLVSVPGITRFYLQEIRPDFTLFVDPINISPFNPIPEISTPADWASELAKRYGAFYTKGMPEDTKALEEGVLSYDEYRHQSMLIYQKRKSMMLDLLDRHDSGLLFYYFCSIDLDSHMFWRCMDENHPGYDPAFGNKDFLKWLYMDMDQAVGAVRQKLREGDTLIVMSDHGFAPYYRSFNLNTWLLENGYIALKEDANRKKDIYFSSVDWSKTRAYNLGFAGIYINKKGRGPNGIVEPGAVHDLTDEICSRLMNVIDPKTNEPVFLCMYKTREIYTGDATAKAPEIVVGCKTRFRVSNASAMGQFPEALLTDNLDAWSGCHLMAAEEVPGILLSNKKIVLDDPKLYDMTVTILREYGIEKLPELVGRPIFR